MSIVSTQKKLSANSVPTQAIPMHVGIIMDGNGRWATQKGLNRQSGHKAGVETMQTIVEHCFDRGIACVTVFAFSQENWQRPQKEIDGLFDLVKSYLKRAGDNKKLKNQDIRVDFIGDLSVFDTDIKDRIQQVKNDTADCKSGIFNIALNYGATQEILNAVNIAIATRTIQTNETFSRLLYTKNSPELDLIIRTGGHRRLSNFLLYQAAYAELVFTDTLWPDFNNDELDDILAKFAKTKRNFGAI